MLPLPVKLYMAVVHKNSSLLVVLASGENNHSGSIENNQF